MLTAGVAKRRPCSSSAQRGPRTLSAEIECDLLGSPKGVGGASCGIHERHRGGRRCSPVALLPAGRDLMCQTGSPVAAFRRMPRVQRASTSFTMRAKICERGIAPIVAAGPSVRRAPAPAPPWPFRQAPSPQSIAFGFAFAAPPPASLLRRSHDHGPRPAGLFGQQEHTRENGGQPSDEGRGQHLLGFLVVLFVQQSRQQSRRLFLAASRLELCRAVSLCVVFDSLHHSGARGMLPSA